MSSALATGPGHTCPVCGWMLPEEPSATTPIRSSIIHGRRYWDIAVTYIWGQCGCASQTWDSHSEPLNNEDA